jgi:hypothetical protein
VFVLVLVLTILASSRNLHSHRPLAKHPRNLSVEAWVSVQIRMRLVATRGDRRWWTCKSRRVLPDKRIRGLASLWSRTVLDGSAILERGGSLVDFVWIRYPRSKRWRDGYMVPELR